MGAMRSHHLETHRAHRIGWVLALHLNELMGSDNPDNAAVSQARYDAAIERLSAAAWLKQQEV